MTLSHTTWPTRARFIGTRLAPLALTGMVLAGCGQTGGSGSTPTVVDDSATVETSAQANAPEETSVDELAPEFGALGTLPGGDGSAPPYVLREVDLPEGWRPSNPSGPYPDPLSVCEVVAPTPKDAATRRWARETLGPFLESHAMTSEPGTAAAFVEEVKAALPGCTSMNTESGKARVEPIDLEPNSGDAWVGWRITYPADEGMVNEFAARAMDDALVVLVTNTMGDEPVDPAVLAAAVAAADRSLPYPE